MSLAPEEMRLAQAAMAAMAKRDFAAAKSHAQALVLRNPNDANANQILGVIALEQGDAANAKRFLERAVQAAPNQAQIVNTLGVALRRLGETDAARDAFRRAGALGSIDGWRNLGNLEDVEQRYDASIAAYEHALRIAPSDAAAHGALAAAYERRHDLARARSHAERALASDARNENARLALARVLIREGDFAAVERVVAPAAQAGAAPSRALAWGLIGDARDRLDDARGAFAAFTAANRIGLEQHRALLNASHLLYHPDGVRRMRTLVESADATAWRAPAAAETPAFLVGFPRSGTTLLDQILSSHSAIVCIDEREHFANALASVLPGEPNAAVLASMTDADIEAIRGAFWASVRAADALPAGARVVDKLPLNIVVLPMIRRVFPDAKIILALRDPRDVILSCYQQRFTINAGMAQLLQLETAAAYYDEVMRLMEACRERLDLDLIEVRYEDVVADLEANARRLAAFLGVTYEPAMLAFRETALKRNINTPSARQVIEPLYTRSIGRWRRYANELAPVLPILEPWVTRYRYPL